MGVETGALAELGAMCPLSFLPSALTMLQKIAEGTAVVTLLPRHQNPLSSHMSHVHPCDSLRGSSRWADHGLCPVRSPGGGFPTGSSLPCPQPVATPGRPPLSQPGAPGHCAGGQPGVPCVCSSLFPKLRMGWLSVPGIGWTMDDALSLPHQDSFTRPGGGLSPRQSP